MKITNPHGKNLFKAVIVRPHIKTVRTTFEFFDLLYEGDRCGRQYDGKEHKHEYYISGYIKFVRCDTKEAQKELAEYKWDRDEYERLYDGT
jgi:hypothetical protein